MIGSESGGPPADSASRQSWLGLLWRCWRLKSATASHRDAYGVPYGVPKFPYGNPRATIIWLTLGWLAAWVAIDRWQRQPAPHLSPEGIPVLAWYALGTLSLAGVLRVASRPMPPMNTALLLALGAAPVPFLLVSVIVYFAPPAWYYVLIGAAVLYDFMFLLRGLVAITGGRQAAAALAGVLFIAAFVWASDALDAIPDVWAPQAAASAGADDAYAAASEDDLAEREAALFLQADKIDAALEHMTRGPGAGPQAFFLGFGGVGEQKVFAQEVALASRVLGARYRMGERRLSLVNDERHLEAAPLASVSGLNYALEGIAARMDLDTDILFLAISSHGSPDSSIAVSNAQMPFTALTADDLEDALNEAGIRWRVIVVSACYAGGFIDVLKDPKAIVITAAAKDRTSFGCSNDSDLTYFGEAFYRDALPDAQSLRAAFETAKKAVAERERAEGETPSNPQAWFGAEMERRLDEFSRQP